MPENSPLPLLIELANSERDAVARQFATARRLLNENEAQHASLQAYHGEYLARLGRTSQSGSAELRNFHAFLVKLEEAIRQQGAAVDQHRKRVTALKCEFAQISLKVKSLETLHQQRLRSAGVRERKREQKIEDEHAARVARNRLAFGHA